jgi:hypothetical protein
MSQALAIIYVKGTKKRKSVNLFSDMACGLGKARRNLNGIL